MMTPTETVVPGEVSVWYARTAEVFPSEPDLTRGLEWLTGAEAARAARFRRPVDRAMFLLGRVMARTLVGRALGVDPGDWRWREGDRGRPEVDDEVCGISFNIAHSAGLVACALACDVHVGVDVEYRRRPIVDPAIITRYFAPDEAADIRAQGDAGWHDQFLRYWTLKEAYLKARGVGISVPLAELSFTLTPEPITLRGLGSMAAADTAWTFDLRPIASDYFLATAVSQTPQGRPRIVAREFPAPWAAAR